MKNLLRLWWSAFRYTDQNLKDLLCSWCSLESYTGSSVYSCTPFFFSLFSIAGNFLLFKILAANIFLSYFQDEPSFFIFTGHDLIICRCYFIISLSFWYVSSFHFSINSLRKCRFIPMSLWVIKIRNVFLQKWMSSYYKSIIVQVSLRKTLKN